MDNLIVAISGPSDAGKSTIVKHLLSTKNNKYKRISTYTTREKREDEVDEEQYHFITKEEYEKLDKSNKLICKNVIDGCYYRSSFN